VVPASEDSVGEIEFSEGGVGGGEGGQDLGVTA